MVRFLPLFCLFACFNADAALLFQRVPLDSSNSYSLDSENSPFVYEVANPFTLSTTNTIRQIVVWGRTSSTATPTFKVRLYTDAAGTPNTTPVSEHSSFREKIMTTPQRSAAGQADECVTSPVKVQGMLQNLKVTHASCGYMRTC